MAVHFHLVQLERRHNRHDVDAAEEACERYQPQSPPEQGVVKHHRIGFGIRLVIDHNIPLSAMYYVYLYARCNISAAVRHSARIAHTLVNVQILNFMQRKLHFSIELQQRRHSRMTAPPWLHDQQRSQPCAIFSRTIIDFDLINEYTLRCQYVTC
jgi:hypothetical protein